MNSPHIEIYYSPLCSYCVRALALLDSYDVPYDKLNVIESHQHKKAMHERVPHATTVPQIFLNQEPIGGYDELYAMHRDGSLAQRLGTSAVS